MAEVRAVAPVHAGLARREGDRGGFARVDDEVDVVVRDREAVRQVFDLVQVGQDQRDLVTRLHLELAQREGRGLRRHLHGHLLAVAHHARVLRVLDGVREIVERIDLLGLDEVALEDDEVVRFAAHRVVGQQHHLFARHVDDLLVLGVQRTHWQETVFRELAAHGQVLAVGGNGLRLRAVDVARLVLHVQAVDHVLGGLVAGVELDRGVHVPFHDLAVQEQRGVGVATAVKGGVQRAQADLDLGHDGVVQLLDLAVEPFQHLGQLDHRGGGRELAGADEVLLVRAGVDAVRVLGHRHVGGQRGRRVLVGFVCAVHHGHLGAAEGLELAGLHRRFDAGDVEEDAGIALGGHHVLVLRAHLGVVLVRRGQLAVVGRGHQVAVAVDQHLPAHFHGFGIDAAEQRTVFGRVLGAGVGQRNAELAAAEHARGVVDGGVHRVALVGEDAVEALHVGQLRDLVADEIVQTDARDAAVDLVVDPGVAAVVVAVLVRGVRVVGVAHGVAQRAIGLGAHDRLGLVGDAPAHQGVGHEAGDAKQFATRGHAEHAHVAGVATAPQTVVGVELAGLEVRGVGAAVFGIGGRGRRCSGGVGGTGFFFGAGRGAHRQSRQCGGVQETSATPCGGVFGGQAAVAFHV